jgi:pantoate--beta-alanine ligase
MQITRTIDKTRSILDKERTKGKLIGLVPTMGYFHQGHLSLMDLARKNSDFVAVSLFVNPMQFGEKEDLESYPRDFQQDKKLADNRGVDLLFVPSNEEMYPQNPLIQVSVEKLSDNLCGAKRPGHFEGVLLVVCKLFNIFRPDIAVFGQKDVQQLLILKQLIEDLNFNIRIIACPTVREEDGLAISSRNKYLSTKERKESTVLYQSLQKAKTLIKEGESNSFQIISAMADLINSKDCKIDYIQIVDTDTLKPIKRLKGQFLVALAVYFGKARLIDNIIMEEQNGKFKEVKAIN